MRPSKVTDEARARCAEIAAGKLAKVTYKDVGKELGLKPGHVAKLVHQELEKLREKLLP